MWSRFSGTFRRFCFWGLVAVIIAAGGFGLLPALDAAFLIFGVILFGIACVSRQTATPPSTTPDAESTSPPEEPTPRSLRTAGPRRRE